MLKLHKTIDQSPAADASVHQYLDAVVALTQTHNVHSLSAALIEVLSQWMSADRYRLLSITNVSKDAEFNDGNVQGAMVRDMLDLDFGAPRLIEEDEDLVFCVRTGRRVSRDSGAREKRRMILPVYGARYVTALLVIEGLSEVRCEESFLDKLLRIYSNQAFLLSRNELDALTGLYNRQSFDERIKKLAGNVGRRNRRGGAESTEVTQCCFALLDIDHFKQVNDKFGHLYGDEMLLLLSRLMTRCFRHEDLLFRYGGEEFAVVLSSIDVETAVKVLERFRKSVEAYDFPQIGRKTVSIGVVAMGENDPLDAVVARADKALYFGKNNGRNQVHAYETLVAEGKLAPVDVSSGDIELF